jgi:site-specific DNA-methyltransferase (adenine-specific)
MTKSVVLYGEAFETLRKLADNSVDAVVCDPPYSLSFMSKDWDRHGSPKEFQAWCELWAREALRVAKPGAHLLAFGGTRTYHRLASGIEDAGWKIRDRILYLTEGGEPAESLGPELHWIYGSGRRFSQGIEPR